ncbi:MAG: hypothetical protein ACSLFP_01725 [Acidimicrobiales bacterium]
MEAPRPQPLTVPRLLGRGIRRRCPLCGNGDCFRSFFEVRDRCPTCNFPLRREEGHWIGAVGMNTVVSFGALLVTLVGGIVLTWEDRRAAPIFISCFAVATIVPIVFFGPSQTLWSAVDLAMRPPEPSDDVDPVWLPPPVRRG